MYPLGAEENFRRKNNLLPFEVGSSHLWFSNQ
uniref:Uncharacterized protein n=1 Tax=Anguilla anguilla TaxID=7936 RepID=A0A0E9T252_ANGAN